MLLLLPLTCVRESSAIFVTSDPHESLHVFGNLRLSSSDPIHTTPYMFSGIFGYLRQICAPRPLTIDCINKPLTCFQESSATFVRSNPHPLLAFGNLRLPSSEPIHTTPYLCSWIFGYLRQIRHIQLGPLGSHDAVSSVGWAQLSAAR